MTIASLLRRTWAAPLVLAAAATLPPPAAAQVIRYHHLDALGSVRALTGQNGAVLERHDYLPFGEECTTGPCAASPGAGGGHPRKFTGKERDAETGFDYFGARYYGAGLGRFTSVDPVYTVSDNLVDPQRWNRYAYARNNPLRYVDPDGRKVRVTRQGDTIVVTVPVKFVKVENGPDGPREVSAPPAFRERVKNAAEETWSGTFGKHKVRTEMTEGTDNTIYLVSGSADAKAGAPDGSAGYDAITLGTPSLNRGAQARPSDERSMIAHEVGHLMYLRDQYDRATGQPFTGENDIMAKLGGNPDERTIDRLLAGYRTRPSE